MYTYIYIYTLHAYHKYSTRVELCVMIFVLRAKIYTYMHTVCLCACVYACVYKYSKAQIYAYMHTYMYRA